jgi:DNA-binding response OmpR family regulator
VKQFRVLLADNYEPMLKSYAKLFQRQGYNVTCASSYEDAKIALREGYFHLAVLDRRLRNNEDELDNSGAELAKEKNGAIAKIILTAFPTFETARDALAPDSSGERPLISYVSKREPSAVLFDHVERTMKGLGIRRDLPITWTWVDRTFVVQGLTGGKRDNAVLEQRIEEVEDLVIQLFPKAVHVHLERLLWQKSGRSAILTRAVFPGGVSHPSVVLLGKRADLLQETERMHSLGVSTTWPAVPFLERTQSTVRFAASALTYSKLDLLHSRPLAEVYRHGPEKSLAAALQQLMENVLPHWYKTPVQAGKDPRTHAPGLWDMDFHPDLIARAVSKIKNLVGGLGVSLRLENQELRALIGGREHIFPAPDKVFDRFAAKPVASCLLPGVLDGNNILVDDHGNLGLTNFAEIGGGPLLAAFWDMECMIRFDLAEDQNLGPLFETECMLTEGNFSRFDVGDVDPSARKAVKAVLLVRREAERFLQEKRWEWHSGIFREIALRVTDLLALDPLESTQLLHMAHLVLAAALTARAIGRLPKETTHAKSARDGLEIDEKNLAVLIRGERTILTRQSFKLFKCLFQNLGKPCEPEMLLTDGLGESSYDPDNASQKERLLTAIHRLRERIEQNPAKPRLLRTEPGGYCLHPDPEK